MVIGYLLIPVIHLTSAESLTLEVVTPMAAAVAQQWFLWTLVVVAGRVAYLVWKHNLRLSMVWFVKLVTDPFTDIVAYAPRYLSAGQDPTAVTGAPPWRNHESLAFARGRRRAQPGAYVLRVDLACS